MRLEIYPGVFAEGKIERELIAGDIRCYEFRALDYSELSGWRTVSLFVRADAVDEQLAAQDANTVQSMPAVLRAGPPTKEQDMTATDHPALDDLTPPRARRPMYVVPNAKQVAVKHGMLLGETLPYWSKFGGLPVVVPDPDGWPTDMEKAPMPAGTIGVDALRGGQLWYAVADGEAIPISMTELGLLLLSHGQPRVLHLFEPSMEVDLAHVLRRLVATLDELGEQAVEHAGDPLISAQDMEMGGKIARLMNHAKDVLKRFDGKDTNDDTQETIA